MRKKEVWLHCIKWSLIQQNAISVSEITVYSARGFFCNLLQDYSLCWGGLLIEEWFVTLLKTVMKSWKKLCICALLSLGHITLHPRYWYSVLISFFPPIFFSVCLIVCQYLVVSILGTGQTSCILICFRFLSTRPSRTAICNLWPKSQMWFSMESDTAL